MDSVSCFCSLKAFDFACMILALISLSFFLSRRPCARRNQWRGMRLSSAADLASAIRAFCSNDTICFFALFISCVRSAVSLISFLGAAALHAVRRSVTRSESCDLPRYTCDAMTVRWDKTFVGSTCCDVTISRQWSKSSRARSSMVSELPTSPQQLSICSPSFSTSSDSFMLEPESLWVLIFICQQLDSAQSHSSAALSPIFPRTHICPHGSLRDTTQSVRTCTRL
mmetsp:Transcript_40767/g.68294  ORF Transcript_40767/g.68294 Transcript_40767/m.68294 type:complete len:226 (+) Transcript_40767:602-1279(+)